jgi:hypothetical protein
MECKFSWKLFSDSCGKMFLIFLISESWYKRTSLWLDSNISLFPVFSCGYLFHFTRWKAWLCSKQLFITRECRTDWLKTTNPLPDYPVLLPGFLLLLVGLSWPLLGPPPVEAAEEEDETDTGTAGTGRGGRPRRGGVTGDTGEVPKWGLIRSTETASDRPPMSTWKTFSDRSRTL